MVGSYWMGGSRREGEGRGSGWQLLDGRQEGGGGEGEWLVAIRWEAGGRGRGGEICTYTHLSLAVQQCSEFAQCDDRGNTRHST